MILASLLIAAQADATCAPYRGLDEVVSLLLLDGGSPADLRVGSHRASGVRLVSRELPGLSDRLPVYAINEFVRIFDRSPMSAGSLRKNVGPRRVWLLDAETLAILAENEIPFERDYFVFE